MLDLQEDSKGAKQFFLYLVNIKVPEQKQSFLENLGTAISAEARKILPSLLKNLAVNSQN